MGNDLHNNEAAGSSCLLPPSRPLGADSRAVPNGTRADVVYFDLGGVLYDDSLWRRWLWQLLSRVGLQTRFTLFFRLWEREYQPAVLWGRIDYWQALRRFLLSAGLTRGQVDEVEAAGRARFRQFEQDVRPFPQVRATLARLAGQGMRLGIASAAPFSATAVASQLERLKLLPWFSILLSAQDLPTGATREERFRAAANMAAVPADRVAYVGRIAEELEAAACAGLLTIAYNQEADAVADLYVDQFHQLFPLLLPPAPLLRAAG